MALDTSTYPSSHKNVKKMSHHCQKTIKNFDERPQLDALYCKTLTAKSNKGNYSLVQLLALEVMSLFVVCIP